MSEISVKKRNQFYLIKNFFIKNQLLIIILIFIIVIGIYKPVFLSTYNLMNILRTSALLGIVSIGMTFIMISGGIDLSIGSVMGLVSVIIAGLTTNNKVPIYYCIIVALLIGIFSGLINGVLITRGRITPFIATLATMVILRGVDLIYSNSRTIPIIGLERFFILGRGTIFSVPIPLFIFIIISIIAIIFLKYHTFGNYIYAIGGNYEASKYSGIRVDRYILISYIIGGCLASLSGIIYTARLASGQPMLGENFEMMSIAAVCVGGTSLLGGIGSIYGTLMGAILISALYNSMSIIGLSTFLQEVAVGIVLVIAVIFSIKRKRS
jgi:ribose/xylose/arabinose/galactoside ABC-type transport system permease subunit